MIEARLGYLGRVLIRVTIKGHANYDKKGSDIVCAAVSVLARTVVRALVADGLINKKAVQITDDKLAFKFGYDLEAFKRPKWLAGNESNSDNLIDKDYIKQQTLAKLLRLGLEDIAKEYPDNVKLSIELID